MQILKHHYYEKESLYIVQFVPFCFCMGQSHGPIYLFSVGLPSLFSAITKDRISEPPFSTHAYAGVEMDANRRAAKYFGEKYGVDWNAPYIYPFKKEEDRKKYYNKRIVD
jgi:hypothetical protein